MLGLTKYILLKFRFTSIIMAFVFSTFVLKSQSEFRIRNFTDCDYYVEGYDRYGDTLVNGIISPYAEMYFYSFKDVYNAFVIIDTKSECIPKCDNLNLSNSGTIFYAGGANGSIYQKFILPRDFTYNIFPPTCIFY